MKRILCLGLAPLVMLVACGGGGSDGGGSRQADTGQQVAPLTSAAGDVPVIGNLIADCRDGGIALADSLIEGVNSLDALPTALPTLSQVVDLAHLDGLPIVGGLVAGSGGDLLPIPLDSVLGLLPGRVGDLAGGIVAGQLPVLCSSVLGALPGDLLGNPGTLASGLGVTGALGVIPIFDQNNSPVGSLLTVVLDGLPAITSLVLGPISSIPIVGSALGGLVSTVLGLLGGNGLLGGSLLGSLLGLLPL